MSKLIRKISIGANYKNDAMHYAVGQEVYGGHTICDIIEEEDKFSVYIKKGKDVLPWKDFNKNMAVSVEYNLTVLMKSVHDFVVTPKGERYNNTKQLDGGELILNTDIFNHQFVNREATVTATPLSWSR